MQEQMPQSAVNPDQQKQEKDKLQIALRKLTAIEDLSPRDLYQKLEEKGYIGQEEARRRLCLMAYRHIRRVKDHFLKKIPLEKLPQKSNVLIVGPTGCGKTYLAELLFSQILKIPVVTVDMTGYVETGYMGKYVPEILSDLLNVSQGNPYLARIGICILDEFDKISSRGSNTRFGGGGTTKDVSGYGVQRSLLKLIEGGKNEIMNRNQYGHQIVGQLETDCISFLACGTFSGIDELSTDEQGNNFGFKTAKEKIAENISYKKNSEDTISVETFSKYGFLPELMGRFNSLAHLNPLNKEELRNILNKNVLPNYRQEFQREGYKLKVPKRIIEDIIKKALERKTGARGLSLLLTEYFEEQAFELFGKSSNVGDDIPF